MPKPQAGKDVLFSPAVTIDQREVLPRRPRCSGDHLSAFIRPNYGVEDSAGRRHALLRAGKCKDVPEPRGIRLKVVIEVVGYKGRLQTHTDARESTLFSQHLSRECRKASCLSHKTSRCV